MAKIELIPYIPETGSYQVYYPKDFILNENEDAIVTITSPETCSNLTISGYQASRSVDEKVLSGFFQELTEGYSPLSEIRKETTENRLLLECSFIKDNIYWLWWALSEENQIIISSVNSETEFTTEDYNLYKFILDRMEIYPSEFEE